MLQSQGSLCDVFMRWAVRVELTRDQEKKASSLVTPFHQQKECVFFFFFLNFVFSEEIQTLEYDSHKQRYLVLIMPLCCRIQFGLQPLHSLTVSVSKISFFEGFHLRRTGRSAARSFCCAPPQRRQEFEALRATVGKQNEKCSVKIPCVAAFPN